MWKHLFVARALSVRQCGMLTMIDTPNFFFCLFFFFFFFFLFNVETSLYINVATFLPFLILSRFQYFIIVSIPHSVTSVEY